MTETAQQRKVEAWAKPWEAWGKCYRAAIMQQGPRSAAKQVCEVRYHPDGRVSCDTLTARVGPAAIVLGETLVDAAARAAEFQAQVERSAGGES